MGLNNIGVLNIESLINERSKHKYKYENNQIIS